MTKGLKSVAATVIDGKQLAAQKRAAIQKRVEQLKTRGKTPRLAVMLVGDDPASATYVNAKEIACQKVGIRSEVRRLPSATTEAELLSHVEHYNEDEDVDGILVQLPLPPHIDPNKVINVISPHKDVDGFHPVNAGRLMIGTAGFLPCTPLGIMEIFREYGISLRGKHAVVVGRSNIVGKPLSLLLQQAHATVTMCHSHTKELSSFTRGADIVIAAVGRANFLTGEDIRAGSVVIDVGINRTAAGKLTGDVDYESVKEKASYITPVPGGVGPMTIAMLLHNTVLSAEKRLNSR